MSSLKMIFYLYIFSGVFMVTSMNYNYLLL